MLPGLIALMLQAAANGPIPPPPEPPPLHGASVSMTCPVGGEPFSAWRVSHYSTFGARPDGKPYSYMPFPFPLPECPGNTLLVFGTFSPAEIERLTPVVASQDYQRLRGVETPYYRAAWLATAIGRPESEALGLLLTATWEAKDEPGGDPGRARRYQAAFAKRVAAMPDTGEAKDRGWLQARAANTFRELGDFRAAEAMRQRAIATFRGMTDPAGWDGFLGGLGPAIARGDATSEPLDLLPKSEAAMRCAGEPDHLSAFDRGVCATPAIADMVATFRKNEAERHQAAQKTTM